MADIQIDINFFIYFSDEIIEPRSEPIIDLLSPSRRQLGFTLLGFAGGHL
jgi:hypothetical protein